MLLEVLTVVAIFTSPVVALYIQRKLDIEREATNRRLNIFKTLMATRASILSSDHVQALNMIDIEFYDNKKYAEVKKAWRSYLNARVSHKVTNDAEAVQFNKDCEITLTNLLLKIGETLGYNFDETHLNDALAGSWRVEESWLEAAVILKKCSPSHLLDERPHDCPNRH